MYQPEQHHRWLHTSFVVKAGNLAKKDKDHLTKSDAISSAAGANLRGRRVWIKHDIRDNGNDQLLCEANTGGTVAFQDQVGDMVVRWDNGQITMHHKDALFRMAYLIGGHRTLKDHLNCLANRCRCAG